MIDGSKFNYDHLSLVFKDKETEEHFKEFSYGYDSQSLKILSIGIIVSNVLFLVTKMIRSGDITGTLIFTGSTSCFMLLGVLNSRLVKDHNSDRLQLFIFIANLGLVFSFFLARFFLDLPGYSLPNAIYTLMLLSVLFSGLRFRYAIIYSLVIYALYLAFSIQIFNNQFWISQINNLTIYLIVILIGAYMMEKFKRNIFVTHHIIDLQKKDLVSSDQLKTDFLSLLSHDLQGPINRLITILNLWRGKHISRDELFDFIKKIEKEVEKTSSLMDNMLYWSRNIQKGDQNKSTVINIYEIIQQNISLHHDKLLWKEISCKNLVDPTVRVCLDINTLNLCLRNLISNAIKFTPATGLIEIGFNQKGGFAEFFLSDTGVGIPVERQKKLFCVCRDSVQGTEGEQGAGMGLHIVKEFLDRIGGYIRYENKPDRGSTFVFGLPGQQIKQRFHRAESMSELEA